MSSLGIGFLESILGFLEAKNGLPVTKRLQFGGGCALSLSLSPRLIFGFFFIVVIMTSCLEGEDGKLETKAGETAAHEK